MQFLYLLLLRLLPQFDFFLHVSLLDGGCWFLMDILTGDLTMTFGAEGRRFLRLNRKLTCFYF